MKSIKIKLVVAITLILSIFFMGITVYSILFKPYYTNAKLKEMNLVTNELIKTLPTNDSDKISSYISEVSIKYNFQIDIIDTLDNENITSLNKNDKTMGQFCYSGMNHGQKNRFKIQKNLGTKDDAKLSILRDMPTGVDFLASSKSFSKYLINIKTPISAIDDSLKKSLTLLFVILLPIGVLALIATYYFSTKFTSPIMAITSKALNLQNLNYTKPLDINSKDEIGNLSYTINCLSDRIESSLLELTEKNQRLKELIYKEKKNDELRREFVSSVSHELKTPITVISGYAQALNSNIVVSDDDKSYYTNVICDEAERMEVIVNDLLDLYKLQSNTFKITLKEIELSTLLTTIINKLDFRFKENNIKLKTNINNAMVLGDKVRLEQAIVNFINNALHHVDDKKIIEINLKITESTAVISVYNSGLPIPEENLDTIWSGFVRLDKVRNYKDKRVGLGLAIVDQIVKLHSGEKGVINKYSNDNLYSGVEFYITLPLVK
ncbi:sensor histidine kinase [Clostridium cylindrosporum]|uniref:histidine kinase n=1 Tax=Clostridium cylindrosporum DSM 605 TaxID=1121307 RepID=A0A0J8D9K2_CLOCY|nr:HAMP domain-containing sensor histidine kinase [Clostridium cylindrosporum]KMT20983.1 sensor histidine kinase ResE [Clostridium cylindrosporum DSM 605]